MIEQAIPPWFIWRIEAHEAGVTPFASPGPLRRALQNAPQRPAEWRSMLRGAWSGCEAGLWNKKEVECFGVEISEGFTLGAQINCLPGKKDWLPPPPPPLSLSHRPPWTQVLSQPTMRKILTNFHRNHTKTSRNTRDTCGAILFRHSTFIPLPPLFLRQKKDKIIQIYGRGHGWTQILGQMRIIFLPKKGGKQWIFLDKEKLPAPLQTSWCLEVLIEMWSYKMHLLMHPVLLFPFHFRS